MPAGSRSTIEAADTRVTEGNTALCSPHHRLAPRSCVEKRRRVGPHPVAAETIAAHEYRPPRPCHAKIPSSDCSAGLRAMRAATCAADGSRLPPITQEETMQFGYFTMPSHPPERPLKDGHEWDLQVIRWLDELGFAEAWIGEHHTAPWEPHPAPDLLVAQAPDADQEHPPRARRLPAALSSPGRARQPRRHARPHLGRPAQFRRRRVGPAQRLGDVQRRRHVGRQSRHDPRGAGDHPEAVELARAVRLQGQVLERHQARHDVRRC